MSQTLPPAAFPVRTAFASVRIVRPADLRLPPQVPGAAGEVDLRLDALSVDSWADSVHQSAGDFQALMRPRERELVVTGIAQVVVCVHLFEVMDEGAEVLDGRDVVRLTSLVDRHPKIGRS